jgi:hypothetical protein
MAFFDKELLVSAGIGGLVGLAVGATSSKKPSSDLYWFFGLGAVVAGAAVKWAETKRAPGHLVGHYPNFDRPGWPSYEHDWDPSGFPEYEQHLDPAGWPRYG